MGFVKQVDGRKEGLSTRLFLGNGLLLVEGSGPIALKSKISFVSLSTWLYNHFRNPTSLDWAYKIRR